MEKPADPAVTLDDVRAAGFCLAGLRYWLNAQGFDERAALRGGLRASQLEETGCDMAVKIARIARARSEEGEI